MGKALASGCGSAALFIGSIAMPVAFPDAPEWIGQIGLVVAALLLLVAVWLVGLEHKWWAAPRLRRTPERVTFAEIVRRAALETEWALDYNLQPYQWPRDLQRQVLDPFAAGQIEAMGLYSPSGKPDATAITSIPASFWASAKFTVEVALASHHDVLVFDSGMPCAAVAEEITVATSDFNRIWPRARRRGGRVPAIKQVVKEWMAEEADRLPDRLEWATYVKNQRQLERFEKRRTKSNDASATYSQNHSGSGDNRMDF